nr:synaptobrevin, longin-like domain protein [Tanacetum cinerariifolium]
MKAFSQTLKRPGPVVDEPSTKRSKSPEAPTPSMPKVPISPVVTSPASSHTRRKSLGRKPMHKPKSTLPTLYLDAPAQTFLKVVIDEDSDDEDSVDEVWSAVVGCEVLSTPLGAINDLYRIDGTTKHFATLCQILHMVDRQDLMKLYGLVVQYYEHHPATVSGKVLSMFTNVSYPLLVELMKKMLMHKLEIDSDFVGNDLTIAEQLIQFIKNQIVVSQASSVLLWTATTPYEALKPKSKSEFDSPINQTIVAISSTEAEYVAATNCCGQPDGSSQWISVPSGIARVPASYVVFHTFWLMATLRAPELGPPAILATIDKTPYTITEELVRSRIQLADDGGVADLPILNIYSGMDNLGYVTEGKLTFFKNKFSPQWRFLVHTLLHCLSTKSGSWDQFGSPIAIALICLSDGRRFNWSNYIFKGMVSNIGNAKKFLMYPRFL